ncbi:CPBP family intramembrane metalloprotease [Nakamurella antarctica]|uniref:CPBP family intramembrane metalloprotease n=1 Tax=Nakamurella antarctica TaxID=1902245 RepID=A0A3G8ZN24_9ACTN|nr:type II CAAX endopeptidase family protein [Nakamurella antarctica]AZI58195.1 CPBP family intramembrane metalloprotease [Nakamurella antarctica]
MTTRSGPTWVERARRIVAPALIDVVDRDHAQSDRAFHRRRVVSALTLVVGATLLGISLAVRPGDAAFYPLALGLAAVWVVGGFASGPLHLGWMPFRGSLRRPVITPITLGLVAGAIFIIGALLVRQIPVLRDYTQEVLDHAKYGSLWLVAIITVANGIAEEIFFRGALYAAIGRRYPVKISALIYALTTCASGNPMLVFAALLLGIVLGLQRRASGGILGPVLTHITWSMAMLFLLPPLFSGF